MDEDFELHDVGTETLITTPRTSGGLPDDQMNIDQSHGGKGQKTCNNCGKTGHLANKCRSNGGNNNQNNNNGPRQNGRNNGGKNNVPRNQNDRGNNGNAQQHQKGRNGNKTWVDPASTNLDDQCYMHHNGKHTNSECTSEVNVWSPSHNNNGNGKNKKKTKNGNNNQNQNQNQNQNHQQDNPAQHENRHGNKRTKNDPISGANLNFCEFCNVVGHELSYCNAPKHVARNIIKCLQCGNLGHVHTECRHPAFCADCKSYGHSREVCRTLKPHGVILSTRSTGPADWVLPTSDAPSSTLR